MSRKESTVGIFNKESRFTKATAAVASVLAAGAIAGCSPKGNEAPQPEQTTSSEQAYDVNQTFPVYHDMDIDTFLQLPLSEQIGNVGYDLELARTSPEYIQRLYEKGGMDYSKILNVVPNPNNTNQEILDMHSVNRASAFYDDDTAAKIASVLYNPEVPRSGYKDMMEQVGVLTPGKSEYNLRVYNELPMPESGLPYGLSALGSGDTPVRAINTVGSDGYNRFMVFQLVKGKSTIDGKDHSFWQVVDAYNQGVYTG